MPAVNASLVIDNFLSNDKINKPKNDFYWFSGWTHSQHRYASKLDASEAKKLISAIKGEASGKASQKYLLQALHQRTSSGTFNGVVLTEAAAKHLNTFAKSLGASFTFSFNQTPPPHPMG